MRSIILRAAALVLALSLIAPAAAQDPRLAQLMVAAGQGDAAGVEKLLNSGVDPNLKDQLGFTALIMAPRGGNAQVVKLLLAKGADANAKSGLLGYTALMGAAAAGNLEMVKALLASGARVNTRNDDGVTALAFAEQNGAPAVINLLKQQGATK